MSSLIARSMTGACHTRARNVTVTVQTPNTIMRLQLLASMIGHTLVINDATAATFTLIADKDRKTVHPTGVAASAAAIKTALAPCDPTITSAV
jgi:alanine-alpha-ketoisovalerate/valine-pyruvate aminotransferase